MKDILTVEEAARFLHKHPDTIRHWLRSKKLSGRKLSAGKNGIFVMLRTDILEAMVSENLKKEARLAKAKKRQVKRSPRQVRLPL